MSLHSERHVVQQPLIRYATEMGWTYLSPDDTLRLRRGETSPILWDIFIQKAQSLNPGIVDHLKAEEIAGRRREKLEETAKTLPEGSVIVCPGDVTKEDDVKRMVETALEFGGKLDVLVNNAAADVKGAVALIFQSKYGVKTVGGTDRTTSAKSAQGFSFDQ